MCPYCHRYRCALDCRNAPWNHDRPMDQKALTYMLRCQRWRCKVAGPRALPMCLEDIRWVNGANIFRPWTPNRLV